MVENVKLILRVMVVVVNCVVIEDFVEMCLLCSKGVSVNFSGVVMLSVRCVIVNKLKMCVFKYV